MEDNVVYGTFGHAFYGDSGIFVLYLICQGIYEYKCNNNHAFYVDSGSARLELRHNLGLGVGIVSSLLCCTRVLSLKIAFFPSSNYTKLHIVL